MATTKQAASYPLRLPPELKQHFQQKAEEQERSLHWVLVKALHAVRASEISARK